MQSELYLIIVWSARKDIAPTKSKAPQAVLSATVDTTPWVTRRIVTVARPVVIVPRGSPSAPNA